MKKIELGNTGEYISAICLGTAYYGTKINKADSFKLFDMYYEMGGRFIDTANCYADWEKNGKGGDSEVVIGEWIKNKNNRKDIILATKAGIGYADVKAGLKYNQIIKECENSLKRFGVDTIDIYYAHKDDYNTPLEESLKAFTDLIKTGKVRFIGASNYNADRINEALSVSRSNDYNRFSCLQNHYTYLKPQPDFNIKTDKYFPYLVRINENQKCLCANERITLLAYHTMLWGAYAGKYIWWARYRNKKNNERLKVLVEVAKNKGVTPSQLVIAWLLHSKPQVVPLISPGNLKHLEENLDAINIKLLNEEIDLLSNA